MYLDNIKNENSSKAILLIHAYTGTPNDVISVGRGLAREGYTVYLPTLDGHDLDDPAELLNYGIEDWKKNGREAYQTLVDDGFEDISVFGLSLGGLVATDVMLNNDVNRYGVFSSPVMPREESNIPKNFWAWYKFKKSKLGMSNDELLAQKEDVLNKLDKVLEDINKHVKDMATQYAQVEIPTFVAQGGQDDMIDAEIAYDFIDALENADVQFHWYEEAPHVITTGRVGKQTQQDLLAFLEKHA